MTTETPGRSAEQERNARLAATLASGTSVPDLPEVVAMVRKMATANLDVPGPRAAQIADALDKANGWHDAGLAADAAWDRFTNAKDPISAAQAATAMNDAMSDLASWLPRRHRRTRRSGRVATMTNPRCRCGDSWDSHSDLDGNCCRCTCDQYRKAREHLNSEESR
jgi:hypothetical protein